MTINWRWFGWQVALPLGGPIVFSGIAMLLWKSGNPAFKPDLHVLLDVSPWALTFYSLTLISSTMNEFWKNISEHPMLGGSLITVAIAVGLYASFIVIWRHDSHFTSRPPIYGVALLLLVVSVVLSHAGYQRR
jgi:hypothetical protein